MEQGGRMSTPEVYGPTQVHTIRVSNFRCFRSLSLDFHPELTVLTAGNGGGKTAVLDAVAKGLAVFVLAAERVRLYTRLSPGDVLRQFFSDLSTWENRPPTRIDLSWRHESTKLVTSLLLEVVESTETQYPSNDALRLLGDQANQKVGERSCIFPLVAYYGTARLWGEGDFQQNNPEHLDGSDRLKGYRSCLEPTSGYQFLEQWFKNRWFLARGGDERADTALKAVKAAVRSCLQDAGWGDIDWDPVENTLRVEHRGRGWFPIAYTSDGITNIVGLVADLAHRCVRLNPQFGAEAAQKTPGIVLIDEVDMHLHPEWQQTILGSLREAFPFVQFIVTTHSPQVLSTVRRENIRVLSERADGEFVAAIPLTNTYGEPSNDVMQGVMEVDPQPPVPEKAALQRLTELVDQGHYRSPEAEKLMQSLEVALGIHPQLARLHRSIRRQEALAGRRE